MDPLKPETGGANSVAALEPPARLGTGRRGDRLALLPLWLCGDRGDRAELRALRKRQHSLPSQDMSDPGYRRLRYVRYADDTLLGFAGPKAEAEEIKQRLARFLHEELKLELSREKTLITHARTGRARFLGYEITVQRDDRRAERKRGHRRKRRSTNGTVALHVPKGVIKAKCAPYLARGKPARQPSMYHLDDYTLVNIYGARYRGIVHYYLLAGDVFRLNRLHWVMQSSLLCSLADKHRSTMSQAARKYKATVDTPAGHASASRSASPGLRAGNRWSRSSVEFHSSGTRSQS